MVSQPITVRPGLEPHPADHFLRRPALAQATQHLLAKLVVAIQLRSRPASRRRLLLGVARPITLRPGARARVALQLTRDRRRLAIQSCSDLPDRAAVFT